MSQQCSFICIILISIWFFKLYQKYFTYKETFFNEKNSSQGVIDKEPHERLLIHLNFIKKYVKRDRFQIIYFICIKK